MESRRSECLRSSSTKKVWATGAGSARPVVSMRMWSNLVERINTERRKIGGAGTTSELTAGGPCKQAGRQTASRQAGPPVLALEQLGEDADEVAAHCAGRQGAQAGGRRQRDSRNARACSAWGPYPPEPSPLMEAGEAEELGGRGLPTCAADAALQAGRQAGRHAGRQEGQRPGPAARCSRSVAFSPCCLRCRRRLLPPPPASPPRRLPSRRR